MLSPGIIQGEKNVVLSGVLPLYVVVLSLYLNHVVLMEYGMPVSLALGSIKDEIDKLNAGGIDWFYDG